MRSRRHLDVISLGCRADVGLVYDTDVDRAAIVDRDGREINRNRLIALMGAILLRTEPGSTIVTDSVRARCPLSNLA